MSEEQSAEPVAPEPAARPRFRDRVWDLRTVVVVAVVALLVGGGIGAGLASIGGHDQRPNRFGPGMHAKFGKQFPGRGGHLMVPPGQRMKQRELKQFRQFQKFKQWQRTHPGASASPSPSAQG